jgi:hypothetical protein
MHRKVLILACFPSQPCANFCSHRSHTHTGTGTSTRTLSRTALTFVLCNFISVQDANEGLRAEMAALASAHHATLAALAKLQHCLESTMPG